MIAIAGCVVIVLVMIFTAGLTYRWLIVGDKRYRPKNTQ